MPSTPFVPPTDPLRVLTARGRAFASLGTLTALVGAVCGWRDIVRVGLLLLVLVVIVALVFPRRHLQVDVTREIVPPRVPFGERAEVRTTFSNRGRRSTPLLLAQDRVDYALGNRPRFGVPGMTVGARRTLVYSVIGGARGRHELGPVAVEQSDPFGLTRLKGSLGDPTELVVLPRVVELPDRGPMAAGTGTEGDIPLMLALHGEDDVSIRAFHEGDDLRRVHWPATAHRGEMMMRQEERPAQRRALLVLDTRADAHRGAGSASSLEWAVTAIASTARLLARHDFLLYLVTATTAADGTAATPMPLDQVIYRLAVEPTTSGAGYRQALDVAARLSREQGLLVLASAWRPGQPLVPADAAPARSVQALAYVIDAQTFERREETTLRGPVGDLPAGWRAVRVAAGTSHAGAWESLLAGATPRAAVR